MDKQMTAVEWLENELKTKPKPIYNNEIDALFQQAKALEREQIEEAYDEGVLDTIDGTSMYKSDYFTKTYGDEKED